MMRDAGDRIRIGNSSNYVSRWHDLAAQEVQYRLWSGDPAVGWEGDPNLLLTRDDRGWVLIHLAADLKWYIVCRERPDSSPGALQMLPLALVKMDNLRKDVDAERTRANELHRAAKLAQDAEDLHEPTERVLHGLRKDMGHHMGLTSQRFFSVGGLKKVKE